LKELKHKLNQFNELFINLVSIYEVLYSNGTLFSLYTWYYYVMNKSSEAD